jgi:hypothetical protein
MKKLLFLTAVIGLTAFAAFAQTLDFSGKWVLDKAQSKLDERSRIESVTLDVKQTATEIEIATTTKRQAPADAAGGMGGGGMRPGGGGMGGVGMRGGMGGGFGGDGKQTFTLDGKSKSIEVDGPMGKMPVSLKAEVVSGKLMTSTTRTFNSPMGEVSATTKETWSLSADGKTLTVKREMESPRGTNTSELVFTRQ